MQRYYFNSFGMSREEAGFQMFSIILGSFVVSRIIFISTSIYFKFDSFFLLDEWKKKVNSI